MDSNLKVLATKNLLNIFTITARGK